LTSRTTANNYFHCTFDPVRVTHCRPISQSTKCLQILVS